MSRSRWRPPKVGTSDGPDASQGSCVIGLMTGSTSCGHEPAQRQTVDCRRIGAGRLEVKRRCVGRRLMRGLRAYTESMSDSRIVADHRIMGGVPCVRGTRIPVATIVGLVAQGRTAEEILADYPTLAADDVRAALEFAAVAVSERQVPLRTSA